MKVLNLQCSRQHAFEGWFGSEDDFQGQLARGLVECPLCADTGIQKLPSAPRLNLGGHLAPKRASAEQGTATTAAAPDSGMLLQQEKAGARMHPANLPALQSDDMQASFLKALREVLSQTEDVGSRFVEEARRMHYGETESRGIRGQASVRETVELLEEGIEVMPLPPLPALKETLQ